MRNLLITIRYVGTGYHGFQVQQNALTVCQVFQDGVEKLLGKRWEVKGCSRTDSGVHARRFCLSMKTDSTIPPMGLVRGLNRLLPPDVAVVDCREVPEDFHARYSCRGKRYAYRFHNSLLRDPFLEGRVYRCGKALDDPAMDRAAKAFLGTHDFSAFCSAGGSVEDKERTIFQSQVRRQGELVTFEVAGDGFLYNMVRIMAGTLLQVGEGRLAPEELPRIIASRDRKQAGETLPPWGLFLEEIYYDLPGWPGISPLSPSP